MSLDTLVIASGASYPKEFSTVYDLLVLGAKEAGYKNIDTEIRWTGQSSSPTHGVLNLITSVNVLEKRIQGLEKSAVPYDIFARSYGCCVALLAAEREKTDYLRRIILWGPVPFWVVWEKWVPEFQETLGWAKEREVKIDASTYRSFVPVESLLRRSNQAVRFCFGQADPYVPEAFVEYLKAICTKNKKISFTEAVRGAKHEVTLEDEADIRESYKKTLFSK